MRTLQVEQGLICRSEPGVDDANRHTIAAAHEVVDSNAGSTRLRILTWQRRGQCESTPPTCALELRRLTAGDGSFVFGLAALSWFS